MNARIRIALVSLCIVSLVLISAPLLHAQDSSRNLSLAVGKTAVIDFTSPVTRVSVGLGHIAEVTAVSPTEIIINGEKAGDTSLIVWEQGGVRRFFNVAVHKSDFVTDNALTDTRRELNLAMPGVPIQVTGSNGLIFLRGTVPTLTDSKRAEEIAGSMGKVINLLYVDVPASPAQILLKVHFMSVDRTRERQLGLNIFSLGATNSIGTVSTGQFSPPTVSSASSSTPTANISNDLNVFLFRPDLNLGATLQALENDGLVESLAEPNLLAEDGKEASFLAGGEYPYPMVQGASGGVGGAVTIEFKQYGIQLNFIPTITPRGTIRLQIAPSVSALDFADAVTISGFTVPAISIRKVQTEVELKNGQSFVIGGLLNNQETQTFEKIPFIGDIPILGKLFQSIQRTKNNTELVVVVTPEIVPPIPAGQPLPKLHYPVKFMPPNTPGAHMYNPTNPLPAPPTTQAIPVEQLIDSMKPEKPLVVQTTSTGGGGMGTSMSGGGSMP